MKIKDIRESTTSGSVATVSKPLGSTQTRTDVHGLEPVEKLMKKKKKKKKGPYANSLMESGMKRLLHDIQTLDDLNFRNKYGKPKAFFAKDPNSPELARLAGFEPKKKNTETPKDEHDLNEADLILMPGQIKHKDRSFVSKDKDRRDHEVQMARTDLQSAMKNATRIFNALKSRTEEQGIMGWQQSYITLASDYLNSVADSIEGEGLAEAKKEPKKKPIYHVPHHLKKRFETLSELVAKAQLAKERGLDSKVQEINQQIDDLEENIETRPGGKRALKNFWTEYGLPVIESNDEDQLEENLKKWFDEKWVRFGPDGKIKGDCARDSDSEGKPKCLPKKKAYSLGKKGRASAAARKRRQDPNPERSGKAINVATKKKASEGVIAGGMSNFEEGVAKSNCPSCGGEMVSEDALNEKKDACYYKVKSRYKVWPSAYASGALVQCRKKGAKNWGKKKVNEVFDKKSLDELIAAIGFDIDQLPNFRYIVYDSQNEALIGMTDMDDALETAEEISHRSPDSYSAVYDTKTGFPIANYSGDRKIKSTVHESQTIGDTMQSMIQKLIESDKKNRKL